MPLYRPTRNQITKRDLKHMRWMQDAIERHFVDRITSPRASDSGKLRSIISSYRNQVLDSYNDEDEHDYDLEVEMVSKSSTIRETA